MRQYFKEEKINGITVVTFLFSELSIEETEEFKTNLYGVVSETKNKFIINMSKSLFLPSLVLGIVVFFNARVKEENGKVVFCSLTEQVKTVFKVSGIEHIFEIYDTQDDAMKAFGKVG